MHHIFIRIRTYEPSFKGKHNSVKSKAWLVLYDRYLEDKPGLSLPELAKRVGSGYKSMSAHLTQWIKWGFVGYRSNVGGRLYHINQLGIEWLKRWADVMPLDRYLKELGR